MTATLNEAGQRLAEQHVDIAKAIAIRTAYRHERDAEELTGEALLALTYAASTHRPELGVPFVAFAAMVVRHFVGRAIHRTRPMRPAPYPRDLKDLARVPVDDDTKAMLARMRKRLPATLR